MTQIGEVYHSASRWVVDSLAVFLIATGLGLMLLALGYAGVPAVFRVRRGNLTTKEGDERPLPETPAGNNQTGGFGQVTLLEEEVEALAAELAAIDLRLLSLEDNSDARPAPPEPRVEDAGTNTYSQEQEIALFREIYKAYEEGQDLAEVARQFGRGKGEVQLILNLRR